MVGGGGAGGCCCCDTAAGAVAVVLVAVTANAACGMGWALGGMGALWPEWLWDA